MDYLQNHVWCTQSNWGDEYNCRHLVSFNKFDNENLVDWENLIDEQYEYKLDKESYDQLKIFFDKKEIEYTDEEMIHAHTRPVPNLKDDVLAWLHNNVKERNDKDTPKGWCIGSTDYRVRNNTSFSVFFHRKSDAMAFIKQFSIHKKPVFYCHYFSNIRKALDLHTGKYTVQ